MSALPEFVGTIHIFLGPHRGNPVGLYLRAEDDTCSIAPTMAPWNRIVGVGETANKAAADFDAKWKTGEVAPEHYSGPHWEGGIKPEKPKPPPKPPAAASSAAPNPDAATASTPAAAVTAAQPGSPAAASSPPSTPTTATQPESPTAAPSTPTTATQPESPTAAPSTPSSTPAAQDAPPSSVPAADSANNQPTG